MSLQDLVAQQPDGVDVVVHSARHSRARLESVARDVLQDSIEGRGPTVYSAAAAFDGSGIELHVAPDPALSDAKAVEAAVERVAERYGSDIGITGTIGGQITGTAATAD